MLAKLWNAMMTQLLCNYLSVFLPSFLSSFPLTSNLMAHIEHRAIAYHVALVVMLLLLLLLPLFLLSVVVAHGRARRPTWSAR